MANLTPADILKLTDPNLARWFENDVDLERGLLYLGTGLDDESPTTENMVKGLIALNARGQVPRIKFLINSPGGDVGDGYAIYDLIKSSKIPVDTYVVGQAMSMAAVVLQAGETRLALPSATIMVHNGSTNYGGESVEQTNLEAMGKWSEKDRKRMYRIFQERTGKPMNYWDKMCNPDYYMSAREAKKEGLIDKVTRKFVM